MNLLNRFFLKKLTIRRGKPQISKISEISIPENRDIEEDSGQARMTNKPIIDSFSCPYCQSKNFVRRGLRLKTRETVQLYQCKSCGRTFTPHSVKGKHYPLSTIFDAISLYNLGYSLEESCRRVNQKTASFKAASGDSGVVGQTDSSSKNTLHQINKNVKRQLRSGPEGNRTPGIRLDESIPNQSGPTQELVSHIDLQASTLSNWLVEFKEMMPFERMRDFAMQKFSPQDAVETATLAHQQLYRYRFHRAKCALVMQEHFHHSFFKSLKEFLELVPSECPHQYFSEGLRASETPLTFSKTAMIVRGKQNFATKVAGFVLQSVKERKSRHEALQKFMLYNDSVTVATEVPVYLTRDDLEHMKTQLGFEIYEAVKTPRGWQAESHDSPEVEGMKMPAANSSTIRGVPSHTSEVSLGGLPKLITGHIDILQIRNGQIHILDYKPNAEKERPIEQLTLYAMALSRLTGLRLFEFKCAWFDEKDYFEFYPLHVLHKPKRASRRRKVYTMEGIYNINKNESKIEQIRPYV